ncbi:hypothetical protein J6R97_07535 [bacterium]|nr:hypothetical protein [bacterium]
MYISDKYSSINFNAVRNTVTDKNYQKLIMKISKNKTDAIKKHIFPAL